MITDYKNSGCGYDYYQSDNDLTDKETSSFNNLLAKSFSNLGIPKVGQVPLHMLNIDSDPQVVALFLDAFKHRRIVQESFFGEGDFLGHEALSCLLSIDSPMAMRTALFKNDLVC